MPDGSHMTPPKGAGAAVILAPEPFAPRVERLEACEGQSVAQILTAAVRAGLLDPQDLSRTVVFLDGVEIEDRTLALDVVPRPGQIVNIAVLPQGGGKGKGNKVLQTVLTIAIIAVSFWIGGPAGPLAAMGNGFTNVLIRTAAAAAVATAGQALTNSLFGPKAGKADLERQARYSLQGQQNQLRRGRMMPLVLGRRRVWFDVASSAYTQTEGEDVYLHVVYGLHYGKCALDLATLKLGETLVSSLPEGVVAYELALTPGPRNFTLYPMRVVEEAYTDELTGTPDEYVVHTTAEDTEKVQIDVSWPGGLNYVNEKGATLAFDAHLHVRYRAVGDTEWINAPLGAVSGPSGPLLEGSIYVKTMTKDALTVTREWTVAKGQYEVAVKKVGPQPTLDGTLTNTVFWAAMRSVENRKPVIDETLACIAMKVKATSTINGQLPQVSGVVTPICPIYADGDWETEAETSNPAALARWLVTGPAAAKPMSAGQIDASCAVAYDLIVEREWEASVLVGDDASQEDVLLRLGRAGRFATYYNGSKLCFVTDWEKPFPRQMFTGRNVKGYRYRRAFPDPVHAVRVQFENLDSDSRADELVVFNDGYSPANADLYETLDLGMACTPGRAYREGRVYLAKAKLHVEGHEWTSGLDGVASTFGDRVRVRHPSALYGAAEGRVTFRRWSGALVAGVRLDEAVTFEAGLDYAMDVRRPDGVLLDLAIVNPGTTTRDIVFAAPLAADEAPGKGDLVAVGVAEQVTEDLEIIDITPTASGEVQFAARAYRADDIMAAETGEIPPLQTSLSAKVGAPRPRIRGAKGSPDGVVVYFEIAGQRTSPVQGFTARWRFTPGTGEDSNWRDLAALGAGVREVRTPPITEAAFDPDGEFEGLRVDVEIRSVLENGDVSEPGSASGILITRDVPAVDNFSVIGVIRAAPDGSSYPVAQIYADAREAGQVQDLTVQFRKSTGGDWAAAVVLPAHAPRGDFPGVLGGETYDFRARWRAVDGWVGAWAYENDVVVPGEGFVSFAVALIDGKTPAELLAEVAALEAMGRKASQAALRLALETVSERRNLLPRVFLDGEPIATVVRREVTERIEGDTAIVEVLDLIGAKTPDGTAFILDEATVKVSPTESLAERFSTLSAATASAEALIATEATARATADSALAQTLSLLGVETGGGTAFLLDSASVKVSPTETLGQRLTSLQALSDGNAAAITAEQVVRATQDSALASSLSTLSATVGDQSSSISVLQSVTSDLGSLWTLALVSGNKVAGIRAYNSGVLSSIVFMADQIGFSDGTSNLFPLAVVGGIVRATNLEVDRIKANSIVTESLQGGAVSKVAVSASYTGHDLYIEQTIHAFSFTCSGGKLNISIFAVWTQFNSGVVGLRGRIYRDGSLIFDGTWGSAGPLADCKEFRQYDEPGPGTFTYTVTMNTLSGITNVISGACQALVTELKKAA